jgi:cyclase
MRRIPGSFARAAAVLVTVIGLAAQPAPLTNLEVLQVRPNFYMVAGAGGNIGFQVGADGVVVVDTGSALSADAVVAAIRKVTAQPIRYVINTSADQDHVGGNLAIAKAGQTLFTQTGGAGLAADFQGGGASILSVEQVLTRMSGPSGKPSPYPVGAWPTETFNQPRKYMYLNGEGIEILHQPAAHSDGDAIVFFRRSDVVVAGDILDTTRFPVIDIARAAAFAAKLRRCRSLSIRPSRPYRSFRAKRAL